MVVLAVNSLGGEIHVARQFDVQSERRLPRSGHLEPFVDDRRRGRHALGGGEGDVVQNIPDARMEAGLRPAAGRVVKIGGLSHARVADGRNEPYEGEASDEITRPAAQDVFALAREIPVEAHAGREGHTRIGYLIGGIVGAAEIERRELAG